MVTTTSTIDYRNIRVEDDKYLGLALLTNSAMSPVLTYKLFVFDRGLALMSEDAHILGGLSDQETVEAVTRQLNTYIEWYKS